jgi:hypothetical protein
MVNILAPLPPLQYTEYLVWYSCQVSAGQTWSHHHASSDLLYTWQLISSTLEKVFTKNQNKQKHLHICIKELLQLKWLHAEKNMISIHFAGVIGNKILLVLLFLVKCDSNWIKEQKQIQKVRLAWASICLNTAGDWVMEYEQGDFSPCIQDPQWGLTWPNGKQIQ